MIYKTPFYAIAKALYTALSDSDIGLSWFDASVPIEEIENLFKTQSEFAYGIIGGSSADCASAKDIAVWDADIDVEVYSNYKGRKVIYQKLEALLNYVSTDAGYLALQTVLAEEGFQLISLSVGTLTVNLPFYGDTGVWQSGQTTITFKVKQA